MKQRNILEEHLSKQIESLERRAAQKKIVLHFIQNGFSFNRTRKRKNTVKGNRTQPTSKAHGKK